jgi:predicted nuclease of predicted toxin-antitoxin system
MNRHKLRFLVDVGVGKKAEKWLLKNSCDIRTVRDMDPRMRDSEILRVAASESRMVITMAKQLESLSDQRQSDCQNLSQPAILL